MIQYSAPSLNFFLQEKHSSVSSGLIIWDVGSQPCSGPHSQPQKTPLNSLKAAIALSPLASNTACYFCLTDSKWKFHINHWEALYLVISRQHRSAFIPLSEIDSKVLYLNS